MYAKTTVLAGSVLLGLALAAAGALSAYAGSPKSSILGSKHDFSVSSGDTIKAVSVDEACVFCHTPHDAAPSSPLWNHTSSSSSYSVYQSTTMESTPMPLTGGDSSKLCLSCHDGTIALGETISSGTIE